MAGPFIVAYTQDELLTLFDRLFPDHWLTPLKDPGPGYEALQAFAKMGERLSEAVSVLGQQAFILTATGGGLATGTVEFYRAGPNPEGIPVTVKAGTSVLASRLGVRFFTTQDVTFGPTDVGPFIVPIQSEGQGYEYNVTGAGLSLNGTLLEGEIDTIDMLVEDPPLGDITIAVRQTSDPTAGGVDAVLDQHGADRNVFRATVEGDAPYRGRVRAIPDTVSPDAFDRTLRQLLDPYGIVFDTIETWQIGLQTCYDAPEVPPAGSELDPNLFVWDDPRPPLPFRNRWLGENSYPAGVIVVVTQNGPLVDCSAVYGDPAAMVADLHYAFGQRAVSAYDIPDQYSGALSCAYDGFDVTLASVYKRVFDTLDAIKAGGVFVTLEQAGQ